MMTNDASFACPIAFIAFDGFLLGLGLLLIVITALLYRYVSGVLKRIRAAVAEQNEQVEFLDNLCALNDWMADSLEDAIVSVEEAILLLPTAVRNRGLHPHGANLIEKFADDLVVYEGELVMRKDVEEIRAYLDGGSSDDSKNKITQNYLVKVVYEEEPEVVLSANGQKSAELAAVALSAQYPEKDTFCQRDSADGSRQWVKFRYGRKVAS